jgi:hypothetical protein
MNALKVCLFVVALSCDVYATSVRPPNFDELVQQSELIVRGRVLAVASGWQGEGAKRHIVTRVTIAVERTLKGRVDEELVLFFMGGKMGGRRLELVAQPRFEVGDHGVYFVENRLGRVCPLVRLGHGRYRIVSDAVTSRERILRDNFEPLREVSLVSRTLSEPTGQLRAVSISEGVTLADFEAQVLQRAGTVASPTGGVR